MKQYEALCTCLSRRAIHIEVPYSLNTNLFFMCLRRFIGWRGNVYLIRSNNGLKFIGASAELIHAFQEIDHSRISKYLEEHGREWIYWGKKPLHLQVTWGEFGNNKFGMLEQSLIPY